MYLVTVKKQFICQSKSKAFNVRPTIPHTYLNQNLYIFFSRLEVLTENSAVGFRNLRTPPQLASRVINDIVVFLQMHLFVTCKYHSTYKQYQTLLESIRASAGLPTNEQFKHSHQRRFVLGATLHSICETPIRVTR